MATQTYPLNAHIDPIAAASMLAQGVDPASLLVRLSYAERVSVSYDVRMPKRESGSASASIRRNRK